MRRSVFVSLKRLYQNTSICNQNKSDPFLKNSPPVTIPKKNISNLLIGLKPLP